MIIIPKTLKYTSDHEWIDVDTGLVGITDFAQDSLGDITFAELPNEGDIFNSTDAFGVLESVKAASDLYMPVDGEIIEINEDLLDNPDLVNNSPYVDGWLVKIKINGDTNSLLSSDEYSDIVGVD
jgi:glycine cleavage system H protein